MGTVRTQEARSCDLSAAMVVIDFLVDYKMGNAINTMLKSKTDMGKKFKA